MWGILYRVKNKGFSKKSIEKRHQIVEKVQRSPVDWTGMKGHQTRRQWTIKLPLCFPFNRNWTFSIDFNSFVRPGIIYWGFFPLSRFRFHSYGGLFMFLNFNQPLLNDRLIKSKWWTFRIFFFLLGNTRYKKSETPFGLNTNKFHIYSVNASCLSPQFDSKAVTLWKAQPQNVTLICSVWDIFCDNCSIYPIFPPRPVDFSSPRTKINFIRIPRNLKKKLTNHEH